MCSLEKSDVKADVFITIVDKHKYGKVVLFIEYFTSTSEEESAIIEELLCCDFRLRVECWLVTVHKVGNAWFVIMHLNERASAIIDKVAACLCL